MLNSTYFLLLIFQFYLFYFHYVQSLLLGFKKVLDLCVCQKIKSWNRELNNSKWNATIFCYAALLAFADEACQKQLYFMRKRKTRHLIYLCICCFVKIYVIFLHYIIFYTQTLLVTDLHLLYIVLSPQDACLHLPQFLCGLGFIEPCQMWQMR